MLSLGIPIDYDDAGTTIVDLNIGGELEAKDFPQDSDFELVAFRPTGKKCNVVGLSNSPATLPTLFPRWSGTVLSTKGESLSGIDA